MKFDLVKGVTPDEKKKIQKYPFEILRSRLYVVWIAQNLNRNWR